MVAWDTSTPKRITKLYFNNRSLTGTLDVSGLPNLQNLFCNKNQLTALDVSGTALIRMFCGNNPLTAFTNIDGRKLTITAKTGGTAVMINYEVSTNIAELSAAPNTGYRFKEWTGLPAGAANTQITSFALNQDETVSAAFRLHNTDATLKSLSLSRGTLNPAFDPAITSYTATVGNAVSSVTVTAEASDPKATLFLGGNFLPSSYVLRLNVGENTLYMWVESESGLAKKEYAVIITREAATITVDTIPGVTAPVKGATPVTAIRETAQYTGAVTWNPAPGAAFAPDTAYTATITLTPKVDYTLQGVAADFFKVEGATATNNAGSGTVTAVFPKTAPDGCNNDNGGDDNNEPARFTITTPQPPKPDNPVLAVIELPVTVTDGTAAGKPDDRRTASAIAEAGKKAVAKQNGIAVQYDAKMSKTYDGFSIVIQRATLKRLTANKNNVMYVTLNTGIVEF